MGNPKEALQEQVETPYPEIPDYPYGILARGTEWLHEVSDPVRKVRFRGQTIKTKSRDLHGFTTYELGLDNLALPPTVSDFLKEGIKSNRLNISTNVFSVPIEGRDPITNPAVLAGYKKAWRENKPFQQWWQERHPGVAKEEHLAELDPEERKDFERHWRKNRTYQEWWRKDGGFKTLEGVLAYLQNPNYVIWEKYHLLWLSTPTRMLEIETSRTFFRNSTLDEAMDPCFSSLAVRFFTIGEDDMIERHDDPRNFPTEGESLNPEQWAIIDGVLQLSIRERQRQLQR